VLIVASASAKQLQLIPGHPVCSWLRPRPTSWVAKTQHWGMCYMLSYVDCWRTPRCLWSASIAPVSIYDEALWRWPTLIAVFHHAPAARRGRVGSYQLSAFGFQIVAVFGRIRIVHLAHYSVRFEFESNIRYSPSQMKPIAPQRDDTGAAARIRCRWTDMNQCGR